MNIYWSRSFPRSNSSFLLCNGIALQSSVLRLRLKGKMFLVDAGPGTPLNCMEDELTLNRATSHRFENKVGSLHVVAGDSQIKERINDRLLMDLVAGQSQIKERAALRFHSFVGSLDVLAGEPLLLPRGLRQNRAWMELMKNWRTNNKVKGFIINKVKGGYSVAIAGFITFLPFCPLITQKIANDRFTIESINPNRRKIVVF
uniref:Ribosomal protein S1 n=1 Tax=Musa coccinea TaxID=574483 RepID=A0A8D5QAP6_9LILI|nr:ribosomal protein S1 [Musa coccinea]